MKTKNKILSAVLAAGIAVGMASMQPVQSFAATGDVLVPFEYDYIGKFENGWTEAKKDGDWGILNKNGEYISYEGELTKYGVEQIITSDSTDNYCILSDRLGNHSCLVTNSGEISDTYRRIYSFNDGLAMVVSEDGERCGFINEMGKEVIPLNYVDLDYDHNMSDFSEGLALVIKEFGNNTLYGYVDKSGNEVIQLQYSYARNFKEGLAAVEKNGKWGYIDKTGNTIIPFKYENVKSFKEGLAAAMKDGKWGYIDKSGNTIIPFKYSKVKSFNGGLARVEENSRWGVINKKGKIIAPIKYYNIGEFSEGLASVSTMYNDGYINKSGKEIVKPKYDEVGDFENGVVLVKKKGKYGYIDKSGKIIVPVKYDLIKDCLDKKIFLAVKGEFCSIITRSGKILKKIKCDDMWSFNFGESSYPLFEYINQITFEANLLGFYNETEDYNYIIDEKGRVLKLNPNKYADISFIGEGLIKLTNKGKKKIINIKGKTIFPIKYDKIGTIDRNGLIPVCKQGKGWGAINKKGKLVIPTKYDYIECFNKGLIKVGINDKYGLINELGEEVIPIKYDRIHYPGYEDIIVAELKGKVGVISR